MSSNSPDALLAFAKEIGWKESVLASEATLNPSWSLRLAQLMELYQRTAQWSSDAVGTIEYKENGERWLALFMTFIDKPRIWRLYERVEPKQNRPNFEMARRSPDMTWEGMGYFDQWPPCWSKQTGQLLQLVTDEARRVK